MSKQKEKTPARTGSKFSKDNDHTSMLFWNVPRSTRMKLKIICAEQERSMSSVVVDLLHVFVEHKTTDLVPRVPDDE